MKKVQYWFYLKLKQRLYWSKLGLEKVAGKPENLEVRNLTNSVHMQKVTRKGKLEEKFVPKYILPAIRKLKPSG